MSYSVVIPVYNIRKSLTKAIRSVLNQSIVPQEIILVDDCSPNMPDYSYICKLSNIISVFKLDQNLGAAGARNKGLDLAKGPYVMFLDSDDCWLPTKAETILGLIKDNPIFVHSHTVNELPMNNKTAIHHISSISLAIKNRVQGSCIVINKDISDINFDDSFRYCEDHEFAVRAAIKYKSIPFYTENLTILGRANLTPGCQWA